MPSLNDEAWLRSRQEAGATVRQIAAELGYADYTVRKAMRRNGVPLPTDGKYDHVDQEAVRADWRSGMAGPAIAQKHGLPVSSVYYLTSGVARQRAVDRTRQSQYPQLNDPAWLRVQLALGHSVRAIARNVGCDDGVVSTWLRRHHIAVPSPRLSPLERIKALRDPSERAQAAAIFEAAALEDASNAASIRAAAAAESHRRPRTTRDR